MIQRLLYRVTLSPYHLQDIHVLPPEAVDHDLACSLLDRFDHETERFEGSVDLGEAGPITIRCRADRPGAARVAIGARPTVCATLLHGCDHLQDRQALAELHDALAHTAHRYRDAGKLLALDDLPIVRPAAFVLARPSGHDPGAHVETLLHALLAAWVTLAERRHDERIRQLGWQIDPHELRVYQEAAQEVRQTIDRDIERLPPKPRKLLLAIRDRFLDPDLQIEPLMRQLKLSADTIRPAFENGTGQKPATYIRRRRFEVATRLLRQTGLEVWKVGRMVGYDIYPCFARAFRQTVGITATQVAAGTGGGKAERLRQAAGR